MRIRAEPTAELVSVNGTMCRRWEGATESGIPVVLFVVSVRVPSELGDRFATEMGDVFETDAPVGDGLLD